MVHRCWALRRFNAPQTFYLTNVLASICYFGCALSNCCHPPNAPWKFRSSESPCQDKRVGQVVIRKPSAADLPPHAHCWFFVSSSALSLRIYIYIFALEGEDAACLCLRWLSALKLLLLRHLSIKPPAVFLYILGAFLVGHSCDVLRSTASWRAHTLLGSAWQRLHQGSSIKLSTPLPSITTTYDTVSRDVDLGLDGHVCMQFFS